MLKFVVMADQNVDIKNFINVVKATPNKNSTQMLTEVEKFQKIFQISI